MKKRVALLRGNSLNPYEMQSYAPLLPEWDLVGVTTWDNQFAAENIPVPVHRVHAYTELMKLLPRALRKYPDFALRQLLELQVPCINLIKHLQHFDIIHTADVQYYYSYQAVQAKKRYGNKVIVTQWENIPFVLERRRASQIRNRETITHADLFLAITERAKEALLLAGAAEEKIRVLPMGIDVEKFHPAQRETTLCDKLGIAATDRVILYAGRLARSKGLVELLCAFARLLKDTDMKTQALKLLCVGTGDSEFFSRFSQRLGIAEQVQMIGGISYDHMPAVHNLAEVFVLPSLPTHYWREQLGMVLLESMACGKAVLATLSGSIPEVVGEAGVLVQPYDHFSLYLALRRLLSDAILREELGRKARARMETHFDRMQIAAKIAEAYRAVLA